MNPYIHGCATRPPLLLCGVCIVYLLTSAWPTRVDATVALGRPLPQVRSRNLCAGAAVESARRGFIVDHQDLPLPRARTPVKWLGAVVLVALMDSTPISRNSVVIGTRSDMPLAAPKLRGHRAPRRD